ncbi:Retrovirus-related Pol polyprotein from type-1 retrotransposable element R2 [Eumeta japonica]|uniref:Retrovirus-related Pol polyprotein from type-1 retrotransposable element R2 n=1 Tax=Eumeta variegata TaxID=151549 RepID=A0A4C1WQ35_EUMVA|nr:Retrovirus-related Pol polyprotein from type-1 retrotransposable element R2 [Eumeta japonica]
MCTFAEVGWKPFLNQHTRGRDQTDPYLVVGHFLLSMSMIFTGAKIMDFGRTPLIVTVDTLCRYIGLSRIINEVSRERLTKSVNRREKRPECAPAPPRRAPTSLFYTYRGMEGFTALETQRDDKAPGPDGISNEVLKRAKHVITPILKDIFNDIIDSEAIPQQWPKSNIILLYKKGDQYDIGNYRLISLMSNIKAFDSLIHANIWEALREQGIEQKYIRLIRNVYKNSSACIQLEKKGDPFKIQKGVRQEDPLSSKLFSAVLEMTFKSFEWQNLGLNIDGRTLTHLRFADDIVLFAKTPDNLVRMLNELASESRKIGLKLNPEKLK